MAVNQGGGGKTRKWSKRKDGRGTNEADKFWKEGDGGKGRSLFGSVGAYAVPENEWKRPTVNMAIWKEWRKKGTRLRRGRSVKLQKAKGWRRVVQEDVHRCSNVEGGV